MSTSIFSAIISEKSGINYQLTLNVTVISKVKTIKCYVFSRRCIRGLTSAVTANEAMVNALLYFEMNKTPSNTHT